MMRFIECFREHKSAVANVVLALAIRWTMRRWTREIKEVEFLKSPPLRQKEERPAVSWMRTACTGLKKLTKQDLYQLMTLLEEHSILHLPCCARPHPNTCTHTLLCIPLHNRLSEGINPVGQWCGLGCVSIAKLPQTLPHSFQTVCQNLPNLFCDSHGSQAVGPMGFAAHGALGVGHAHFGAFGAPRARLCVDGQAETQAPFTRHVSVSTQDGQAPLLMDRVPTGR